MSRVRFVVLVLLAALALPGVAAAKRKPPPTPGQRIATAQKQVGKLPKSSWAKGKRAQALKVFGNSRRALRQRKACRAIGALDEGRNLLLLRSSWKKGRIPRSVSRTIAPSLGKAEGKLVVGARRCAIPSRKVSLPGPFRRGGVNLVPVPAVSTTNTQGDDEGEAQGAAAGPYRPRGSLPPTTSPAPDPRIGGGAFTAGLRADDPLRLFRSSNLGVAPRNGGEPKELTVAVGHNVAWYTGNSSAGYSLDGGKTWTTLDPSTILTDPPNNPLCCDQQVIYLPKQNLFVWLLQYWCPLGQPPTPPGGPTPPMSNSCSQVNGNNLIRFAIATPEDIRRQANAGKVGLAWRTKDFTPAQAGEPGGNTWFDYSTLSANDSYVNWTVDIFEGKNAALTTRINARSLTFNKFQAESFYSNFHTAAAQMPTNSFAQAPETTSYFAANNSYSQTRVYEWRPSSTNAIIHDVNHASIPINTGAALGTDGRDWNLRAGGGLLGQTLSAAWAKRRLWVANMAWRDQCTDKCLPNQTPVLTRVYSHPAIALSKINTSDWTSEDTDIHSDSLNYSWPSLGVTQTERVGISFLAAADGANPQPVAGFLDNDQYVYAFGAAGAQPGPSATGFTGGTGDYYSLQPGPSSESFVMPFRSIDTDSFGTTRDNWRFIVYGHGSPPSSNPPDVRIIAPVDGRSFIEGTPITFRAAVSDVEDGEIPYYAIKWAADGAPLASGGTPYLGSLITYPYFNVGPHTVSVTATDSEGKSTTRSINVTVVKASPTSPVVRITKPTDGDGFPVGSGEDAQGGYVDVTVNGTAFDPKAKPLTITWTDSHIEGGVTGAPVVFSHSLSATARLHLRATNCGGSSHDLTLTADNGTETASQTVRVTVSATSCVK